MKTMFDITEFGAVGDGITNDTAAVQAALDAAAECSGCVTVPPGRYLVGRLNMHGRGVSLQGVSAWTYRNDGASVFLLADENTDCMIDVSGAFGCAVRGLCLNGCGLGNQIHGIKLYWEEYNGGGEEDTPTVDDCRIGNFSGDGVHFEHVWCFSVRHSMLHRNGGAGLYMDGWDAFILDNWFSENRGGGFMGGAQATSITFTGNRIEWNQIGGVVIRRGTAINLTGNYFDRSFGPGLRLGGGEGTMKNVTVTGNVFHRNGAYDSGEELAETEACHVLMDRVFGTTVCTNTFRAMRGDGAKGEYSPARGFVLRDCKDCIVKDNALYQGYMEEEHLLLGANEQCIIRDNVGRKLEL